MNQNIISYTLISIIIAIVIHMYFKQYYTKKEQNQEHEDIEKSDKSNKQSIINEIDDNNTSKNMCDNMSYYTNDSNNSCGAIDSNSNVIENFDPISYDIEQNKMLINACPVTHNYIDPNDVNDVDQYDESYYVNKDYVGENTPCPPIKQVKSAKQFHKDYFGFRDKTLNSSSFREDPVDKINRLCLDGNTGAAKRFPNIKIKDLFDKVTSGPNLYDRQCVRLPSYDNVNYDGYYTNSGVTGLELTRDNWRYKDEYVMNGGKIVDGLYPHDLEAGKNQPTLNN